MQNKTFNRIDVIRTHVPIVDYLKSKGWVVPDHARMVLCICPDHLDTNPSMRIFTDTNVAHCFGCGFHGDVIDLEQKILGCTLVEAINSLSEAWGLGVAVGEKREETWRVVKGMVQHAFHRIQAYRRAIGYTDLDWIMLDDYLLYRYEVRYEREEHELGWVWYVHQQLDELREQAGFHTDHDMWVEEFRRQGIPNVRRVARDAHRVR